MRSLVLGVSISLVLLASSCGRAHETMLDAAVDGGPSGEPLHASVEDARLTTCACHHGCGPGLDGVFTFRVTNPTTSSHVLAMTQVTVDSIGLPTGPYVTPDQGSFHVTGAGADGSVTVAAGSTSVITVTVYLDIPMVEPGTDSVRIDGTLDGAPVNFMFASLAVTSAPGC